MANTVNNTLFRFRFDKTSFFIFLLIFVVEVIIALWVRDPIIRPYGGDILVVMLIYYFVKAFVRVKPLYLCIAVLMFAYIIEVAQYLKLVEVLGLQGNVVMRTVIGSSFSWGDMVAYTIGAVLCYWIETRKQK